MSEGEETLMRSVPNRFWWLLAAVGLVLILVSLLHLTRWLLDFGAGKTGLSNEPVNNPFGMLCVLAVGLFLFWVALRFRKHFLLRVLALRGNPEGMPRAAIAIAPEQAIDLTSQSLEWKWTPPRAIRRAILIVMLLSLLLLAVCLVGGVYVLIITLTNQYGSIYEWMTPAQSLDQWIDRLAFSGFLILLSLIGIKYSASFLYSSWPNHTYIRVRSDGILPSFDGRSSWVLPWEEIRLWEVAQTGGVLTYRLYGSQGVVQWSEDFPWIPRNKEEGYTVLPTHQALLNVVAAKTHLVPRTIDKRLAMGN
jgi:hypothetical protein